VWPRHFHWKCSFKNPTDKCFLRKVFAKKFVQQTSVRVFSFYSISHKASTRKLFTVLYSNTRKKPLQQSVSATDLIDTCISINNILDPRYTPGYTHVVHRTPTSQIPDPQPQTDLLSLGNRIACLRGHDGIRKWLL
jgi:hypothetical protein